MVSCHVNDTYYKVIFFISHYIKSVQIERCHTSRLTFNNDNIVRNSFNNDNIVCILFDTIVSCSLYSSKMYKNEQTTIVESPTKRLRKMTLDLSSDFVSSTNFDKTSMNLFSSKG